MVKNIIYIPSIKKKNKDLLNSILNDCGITASDESIKKFYNHLCFTCGTEFIHDMVLVPVRAEIDYQDPEDKEY